MIEIERLNLMSQGEAEVDNNESVPVTERQLTDMTLAELWELFPIVLVPYAPQWAQWAVEEIELLSQLLAEYSPVVSHIGSTAIPTIWAKPIIDILVELAPSCD
ncbi:MAG: GrpB family protein, partial [Muribaculaceae bacterium]|nr:GrpB family protein [Muribaculaceae bacterium]